MYIIDVHTHSDSSPDASDSAAEMLARAVKLGLSAYALTDHCEVNRWFPAEHYGSPAGNHDDYGYRDCFERAMRENLRLKEEYDGKLNFICGTELGQMPLAPDIADTVAADKRLDFIIGSIHQIKDKEDFYFLDYAEEDVAALLDEYYAEMYELCKWNKFDILGHITYPLRYITGENGIAVDMSRYEDTIRACFRLLAENGKGIEINTSGLRQKYGITMPDLYWLKLFRETGGEIISVGSDAHCAEDIGKGVREGAEIALEAGFKYLCYFKERKAEFISIN